MFQYPASPIIGDLFNPVPGVTYRWNGTAWFLINSGNPGFFTDLTVSGNTILGDAAADTLTVNAGAWTLGNNVTMSRNMGLAPAGASTGFIGATSFTGDPGGTSNVLGWQLSITGSGANAAVALTSVSSRATWSASAALTAMVAQDVRLVASGAGAVAGGQGYRSTIFVSGSGGINSADNFLAVAPSLTSTGIISSNTGFHASNLGHATLVAQAIGFVADDMTASVTLSAGFRGLLSAGANKYNLYIDGTAANLFNGKVQLFNTAALDPALMTVAGASAIAIDIRGRIADGVGIFRFLNNAGTVAQGQIVAGPTNTLTFSTGSTLSNQVQITHTASATRVLTLTGSAAGSSIIGTSAGDISIAPAGVSQFLFGGGATTELLIGATATKLGAGGYNGIVIDGSAGAGSFIRWRENSVNRFQILTSGGACLMQTLGGFGFQFNTNTGDSALNIVPVLGANRAVVIAGSNGGNPGIGVTAGSKLTITTALVLTQGTLVETSVPLTNNAAAAAGTLTNAPTAGNPTKWIPINDNGTVRNIPAW